MKKVGGKIRPLRLELPSYRELHDQVLERDGWRCQRCRKMQGLEVHHRQLRSQGGGDEEQNLITMCAECHAEVHRGANTDTEREYRAGAFTPPAKSG
jgi:5-methylcytosine-specific restriction endonuclease McrA